MGRRIAVHKRLGWAFAVAIVAVAVQRGNWFFLATFPLVVLTPALIRRRRSAKAGCEAVDAGGGGGSAWQTNPFLRYFAAFLAVVGILLAAIAASAVAIYFAGSPNPGMLKAWDSAKEILVGITLGLWIVYWFRHPEHFAAPER
jgi:hypothetical protein